jgi:hypothetical protein
MHQASTSIFPSITPAATASIITGAYPAEHGIVGASWFDEVRNEVAYYGDDFWVIVREGFETFLHDFLARLNGDRLKAPTLFELVERSGRVAACINYLVFRGLATHEAKVPRLLAMLPGVKRTETVDGPSLLCLGDFITPRTARRKIEDCGGPMHRFGMDDESSARMLVELAEDGALGDLTVAYFADNDYRSHEVGPHAALPVVERVDRALGNLFDAAGGFERFARDTFIVVTSDHGHGEILGDAARAVIRLDEVLAGFRRAALGKPWGTDDEILICPNMRAAQIYVREPGPAMIDRIVREVSNEPRIDQILWHSRLTHARRDVYVVHSARGRLEFWRNPGGHHSARDAFGTSWSWNGELSALQMEADGGWIESEEYPNAFERIAGALDAEHAGEVWLTAKPGCEFEVRGGKAHVGGASHGSLHVLDSLSPVIAGGAVSPRLPRAMRSVDIAPLCLHLLGLPMRYEVGDPRGTTAGTLSPVSR